jgi:DNA-binding CsgD family transcriptional regulator/nucleoside-triphosphatase THEP1
MPTRRDLVGREAELAQLSRVLTPDAERAVVISGEPGVGKTALIEQMCVCAAAAGWQVVRVLGVEAEQPFALGGLNQLAFGLKEFQSGLDEQDRVVLAPVFGGYPDSEVAVLPLASGLLNLLAVAGQHRRLLLVVDDVHWLDTISAQVLGAVGRRLSDPRVRIVAGLRTSAESGFSSAGWTELPLTSLDAEDSARLLESAGVPLTPATRTAILQAAQGNPLALVELPRFDGAIEDRQGALPLTERLVAVFGAQLEALDAGVRADLLRAALDGIQGSTTSSTGARFAMRNVAPAVKAGLLVVNPLGEFVFRHPLVRAAVIHQADPEERRDAHRDLAGLYDEVLVRRAAHLAAATVEPDQDVAEVLARAAKLSIRRGGLSVGVEWLRRAAELSTDPDRRAELFADAVFLAARAGRPGGAEDLLYSSGGGEPDSALAVLADSYRAFHADGEVIFTHRRVLEALSKADVLDDKTVNRLAYLLVSITNYAGSAQHREQTNATLLALEARLDPAVVMYRTGVDDIAGTANAVRSMLSGYVELLPQVPAQRMVLLSFPAYCLGMMNDFRAPLQQAFTQLSASGSSIDAVESGRVVILDLIAAGHWAQAEQIGAACLEMAEQIEGSQLRRHQLLADLGVLAAGQGDTETARRYAAEVTAWSQPRGLQRLLAAADRIAVRSGLAEADYEAAYRSATRISAPGHWPRHNIHEVADDMLDSVEAALHSGRPDEGRALAAEAVRMNLGALSPRVAALTMGISAMAAADGDAGELYDAALTHPGFAEFPFERARVVLAQGMWLRRMRRYTEARAALGQAADGFDQLGARPWAERAQGELRAAGASVKQSLGESTPLSAQERRVAELAASGHTTKEIGVLLSISPRTVDGHLYRVFPKLGIANRAGLSKALNRYDSETATAEKP